MVTETISKVSSKIDQNTSVSFKIVGSCVALAIAAATMYADINHKYDDILIKLEVIESEIARGGRWTRENMGYYIREAALLNPDINFPDPAEFITKD